MRGRRVGEAVIINMVFYRLDSIVAAPAQRRRRRAGAFSTRGARGRVQRPARSSRLSLILITNQPHTNYTLILLGQQ